MGQMLTMHHLQNKGFSSYFYIYLFEISFNGNGIKMIFADTLPTQSITGSLI